MAVSLIAGSFSPAVQINSWPTTGFQLQTLCSDTSGYQSGDEHFLSYKFRAILEGPPIEAIRTPSPFAKPN